MTADSRQGAARWFKHLVGAGTTVLCLLVFLRQINISELLGALAHFHWACLILRGISLALGYMLRILRWSMMLRSTGARATFSDCCAPFLGSIALNNILPFRLGDVVRALVFPRSMGITRIIATSSLLLNDWSIS